MLTPDQKVAMDMLHEAAMAVVAQLGINTLLEVVAQAVEDADTQDATYASDADEMRRDFEVLKRRLEN